MTVQLSWSNQAREDLLTIYVAIGLDSPSAAETYYDRLERRARQLSEQPRMGPRRSDIRPGVRMLVEAPYVILYETIPDTDAGPIESLEIVRVVDSRRDLTNLF